jgi:hypothetical protein
MKAYSEVKVKDLRDLTGVTDCRELLHCIACGEDNSANKGDYFACDPEMVFEHCGQNMVLATRSIVYRHIN